MNVVVFFDGVLEVGDAPSRSACAFVAALAEFGRVTVLTEKPREVVDRFCKVHRIEKVAEIRSGTKRPGTHSVPIRQLQEFPHKSFDLVVVSDLDVAAYCAEQGLPQVVYIPGAAPPSVRPDDPASRKSWQDIEAEVESRLTTGDSGDGDFLDQMYED